MFGEVGCGKERNMMAVLAYPFTPVVLKFVPKPLVAVAEHHHRAFGEGTDIGLKVPEYVFSGGC